MPKVKVLFVCLGNICRSPMAEAVFAHKVKAAGLESIIESDSAGTGGWHTGEPPHHGTTSLLKRKNIDYHHLARTISTADLDEFDYVIVMDEENLRNVRRLGTGKAAVAKFLDFAPHLGTRDVPDPYYDGRFEHVYSLVDAAADGLLGAIRVEYDI